MQEESIEPSIEDLFCDNDVPAEANKEVSSRGADVNVEECFPVEADEPSG